MSEQATSTTATKRFDQLDALRGLAALTVVFGHCMRVLPGAASGEDADSIALVIAKYSPLHLVWAGHQAVMFFFVLSGFVLALPFLGGRADPYGTFVVRRVCRIWIPYIVLVSLALCARLLFSSYSKNDYVSSWIHAAWRDDLTPLRLANHASLIGSFNDTLLDPVVWSLTIEMRISIIFPLLIWAVLRWRWQFALGVSLGIGAIGYAMTYVGVVSNLGRTIAYIPLFVVGILLARYREELKEFCATWSRRFRLWTLLAVALLAYTYPYWALPKVRVLHLAPPDDWATTIGVVLFIVAALGSPAVIATLTHRLPMWLGRISYSLYLVHAPVLLSLVHLLRGSVPTAGIWALTVAISLGLATLSHRYVELPAIALGKRITKRDRADGVKKADSTPSPPSGSGARDQQGAERGPG